VHIYCFGSLCRGEVSAGSDVDLLAVVDGFDDRFDPEAFSIYSYSRLAELWSAGNPFAWHLWLEGRLIFAGDGADYLQSLGRPAQYTDCGTDCEKFFNLFRSAHDAFFGRTKSRTFELSLIYLSVRNIATCFSLGRTDRPDFSRRSAFRLGSHSLMINELTFVLLERARLLSTRGHGVPLTRSELEQIAAELDTIDRWMSDLLIEAHERRV
jgi:hypothetical protein